MKILPRKREFLISRSQRDILLFCTLLYCCCGFYLSLIPAPLTIKYLFSFLSSEEGITQNRGVLIHCLAGVSRSVTVTIAYLISALNMTLNEAYDFVKQRKPSVNPNLNFMGQLLEFERQLRTPQTPSSTTSTLSSDSSLDSEEDVVDLNIVAPRCQTV